MVTKYIHPEDVKIGYDVYVAKVKKEASEMGLPFSHEYYHFRTLGAKQLMNQILKFNEVTMHDGPQ